MSRTTNLRRQHDGALAMVGDLVRAMEQLGDRPDRDQAYRITMLLARLTGVLRVHFAQEDRLLYPSLMASGQGGVAAVARDFFAEMGQIGSMFAAYVECWTSADEIVARPQDFRRESEVLFAALTNRIKRENEILYPLADQMGPEEHSKNAA